MWRLLTNFKLVDGPIEKGTCGRFFLVLRIISLQKFDDFCTFAGTELKIVRVHSVLPQITHFVAQGNERIFLVSISIRFRFLSSFSASERGMRLRLDNT